MVETVHTKDKFIMHCTGDTHRHESHLILSFECIHKGNQGFRSIHEGGVPADQGCC